MGDAPRSSASSFDAQALAKDIQTNINLLLRSENGIPPRLSDLNHEAGTKSALAALQRDALTLKPDGRATDGNGLTEKQSAVSAELQKLEARGDLPCVRIDSTGGIQAAEPLPTEHSVPGRGGPIRMRDARLVDAQPGKRATVSDYAPYDPKKIIP